MKTTFKIVLIVILSIFIVILSMFLYLTFSLKNVTLQTDKLIEPNKSISFYSIDDKLILEQSNNVQVVEINKIPKHVLDAFVAIEDKRFYSHNGVDYKGLFRAILSNIKSFSFKEGGSTISQQLIKNTHLSNQKTLDRKISEIKLALELEKKYTKNQILEMYLNTIYFGEGCYGIINASKHYFNKHPSQLTVNEGACLAGIIKSPKTYSPNTNPEQSNKRKNIVLTKMYEQNFIDSKTLNENSNTQIKVQVSPVNGYGFFHLANKELNSIIENYPYEIKNLKVYTTLENSAQELIENSIKNDFANTDKSAILIDKTGKINGFYSTCGDVYKQVGSLIKPLISYAPAIEKDVVYSCTKILDEKTNFNGYTPSNFNNVYYGNISVKDGLIKSSNVCSAKLLNYVGIYKAKEFVSKTDIPLSVNDNSLCIALGSTEKGAKLSQITSAYTLFINEGYYVKPYTIEKIINQNNRVIYKRNEQKEKIFSDSTVSIINDMLEETAISGTAKKLKHYNIPLCSKTGTVGTSNGNTDAYNISYNSHKILGVWYGKKDNSTMENNVTGGTIPTIYAGEFWSTYYKNKSTPPAYIKSKNVIEYKIDKKEYLENNAIYLASETSKDIEKIGFLFKKTNVLKTIDYLRKNPKVINAEISYFNNKISISLCLTERTNFLVYRQDKNIKKLIFDSKNNNQNFFVDNSVLPNNEYTYIIIPYYLDKDKYYYGSEYVTKKIKTPAVNINDWWQNDF